MSGGKSGANAKTGGDGVNSVNGVGSLTGGTGPAATGGAVGTGGAAGTGVTPVPHPVWLSLGSNLGDRLAQLLSGLACLGREGLSGGIRFTGFSGIYETDPVGYLDQPRFYNMTAKGLTKLSPHGLLELCQRAEREAGRRRLIHWGPRTLDVDILLYGDLVSDAPELILPHPRAAERAFVLGPLAEMDPEMMDKWGFPHLNAGIQLKIPAADVKILLEKELAGLPAEERL